MKTKKIIAIIIIAVFAIAVYTMLVYALSFAMPVSIAAIAVIILFVVGFGIVPFFNWAFYKK